jgi:hypothetical protein
LTGFRSYVFKFQNVNPSAAGVSLYLRGSKDNGSTWLSAGSPYVYVWHIAVHTGTDGGSGSGGASQAEIAPNMATDSNHGLTGYLEFSNLASSNFKQANFNGFYYTNGGFYSSLSGGLGINAGGVDPINAIQFFCSAGTILGGTISVYGIR